MALVSIWICFKIRAPSNFFWTYQSNSNFQSTSINSIRYFLFFGRCCFVGICHPIIKMLIFVYIYIYIVIFFTFFCNPEHRNRFDCYLSKQLHFFFFCRVWYFSNNKSQSENNAFVGQMINWPQLLTFRLVSNYN